MASLAERGAGVVHPNAYPGCIVSPGAEQSERFSDMQILRTNVVWYFRTTSEVQYMVGTFMREVAEAADVWGRGLSMMI